jgi:copper chaperone
MMKKVLQVEGMTCQHCVQTVSEAVGKMAGIENVEVKLDQKEVIVEFDESKSSLNEIASQITEAGFEIIKD